MGEETDYISSPAEQTVGSIVDGKFRILSKLGTGGMGVVYKAEHLTMNRVLALKILNRHHALTAGTIQRFKTEAAVLTQLDHPNIVKVFSFGVTTDGAQYIALEYIDGCTLADEIRSRGRLSVAAAIDIFQQIVDAVSHMHKRGVLHRDLKPSNVMIAADGSRPVKLVDFGIAKLIEDPQAAQKLTTTGIFLGTSAYMSPEQCAGQKATTGSDIYSVGCMLYEALAGRRPYDGANFVEVAMKQMVDPPPSLKDVGVSGGIVEIVEKCMQKRPGDRFQTGEELSTALAAVARDPSTTIASSQPPIVKAAAENTRSLAKRKIVPVVSGAALALAAIAAYFIVTEQNKLVVPDTVKASRAHSIEMAGENELDAIYDRLAQNPHKIENLPRAAWSAFEDLCDIRQDPRRAEMIQDVYRETAQFRDLMSDRSKEKPLLDAIDMRFKLIEADSPHGVPQQIADDGLHFYKRFIPLAIKYTNLEVIQATRRVALTGQTLRKLQFYYTNNLQFGKAEAVRTLAEMYAANAWVDNPRDIRLQEECTTWLKLEEARDFLKRHADEDAAAAAEDALQRSQELINDCWDDESELDLQHYFQFYAMALSRTAQPTDEQLLNLKHMLIRADSSAHEKTTTLKGLEWRKEAYETLARMFSEKRSAKDADECRKRASAQPFFERDIGE